MMGYLDDINEEFTQTHEIIIKGWGKGYERDIETTRHVALIFELGVKNHTTVFDFFLPIKDEPYYDDVRKQTWGFHCAPNVEVLKVSNTCIRLTWQGLGEPALPLLQEISDYFNTNQLFTKVVYHIVNSRFLNGQLVSDKRTVWVSGKSKKIRKLVDVKKVYKRYCDMCLTPIMFDEGMKTLCCDCEKVAYT